jgi:hypothetical protein
MRVEVGPECMQVDYLCQLKFLKFQAGFVRRLAVSGVAAERCAE